MDRSFRYEQPELYRQTNCSQDISGPDHRRRSESHVEGQEHGGQIPAFHSHPPNLHGSNQARPNDRLHSYSPRAHVSVHVTNFKQNRRVLERTTIGA